MQEKSGYKQKVAPKVVDEDDMEYERGEGPKIRTNLVRIYDKKGEYKDSVGKRYNLKQKNELGGDLEILGNFDDSDDEEDKKAASDIKKTIINL